MPNNQNDLLKALQFVQKLVDLSGQNESKGFNPFGQGQSPDILGKISEAIEAGLRGGQMPPLTEDEMAEIQKQNILRMPLEVIEAQAQLWADLLEEKRELETPAKKKDLLILEIKELEADIIALNTQLPELLIKDTKLANQGFERLADMVNRKKQLEAELAILEEM